MEKACYDINELVNVFSNNYGSVYQSDKLKCYYIDFGGKFARFNCLSLQKLNRVIAEVDIEAFLLSTNKANFELITFHGCEHIYLLSPLEIVALKDLLKGTFAMLELNHMISDCLHRLVV